METPEERFKRIAEYRVKKILNTVRVLGNCSNRRAYSYTDEQVEKIYVVKAKFSSEKKIDFKL